MFAFFTSALAFFSSLSGVVIGLGVFLSFLVAAIADPAGWLNWSICFVIDLLLSIFPSTPSNLRFESIILSLSSAIPSIGIFAVREAYFGFRDIFTMLIIFKVYKLIPFKAT